jgi:shikimate kinase
VATQPSTIGTRPVGVPARIVLTGFMGSGKSTVGRLLARILRWRFIDADQHIETLAGIPITEIFRQHGELHFRQLEHEAIARLLTGNSLVLALGGGAIEHDSTRQLLLTTPGTRLVHLEASLDTVLKRCAGTDDTRPVLADRANLSARYDHRLPLYRQAHLSLNVDDLPPYLAAQAVARQLGLHPPR